MRVPGRSCFLFVLVLFLCGLPLRAELQNVQTGGWRDGIGQRPTPVGWETRITPGFEPPVEYFLVYGYWAQTPNEEPRNPVAGWGPGAYDVLLSLLMNPEWETYHAEALRLMSRVDSAKTVVFCSEIVNKRLAGEAAGAEKLNSWNYLEQIARLDFAELEKILNAHPTPPKPEDASAVASVLIQQLNGDHAEASEIRLRALAASTTDEKTKLLIENVFKERAERARANEPMHKTSAATAEKRP